MNRKQFFILLVLVIVIGVAGLMVYRNNNTSWHGGGAALGQKLLPNLPVNDVAQIVIKSGTNELTLARQNNLWRVNERAGYPANFSQISAVLIKLTDLKVAQNEEIGPSQLGRFQLLAPGAGPDTGTLVEFKDQTGKSLGSLLLGKKHMKKPAGNSQMGGMDDEGWPDGRYVATGPSATDVVLISDPLDEVQAKPESWLSKDFLNVEKPASITVQFPEATNSWTLTRASETNDWQLADAKSTEKLDTAKISSVTSPFSSVNFNDVGPLNSTAGMGGNTTVTVQTFDGFTYTSKIGAKQGDNYPVSFLISANLPASAQASGDKAAVARQKTLADKLSKEQALTNWIYQLPAYSVDELLKPRQQLLVEPGTNAPAGAEKP